MLELSHGYAWGVGSVDGAVGFVAMDALGAPVEVTHIVCAADAALPMGTRLTADQAAAFDPAAIRSLEAPVKDFVALAEALIGTPRSVGGRSGAGLDAGGLVALTLSLGGIRAPRFVDLQADTLGHVVGADAPMLRGDLIFFADHVAIVSSDTQAVHVGSEQVVREAIADIDAGAIVVRRRLP
ncbi:MAG: NlpC/P60 family protein [Pseudomonadota bacterium]